ncbi:tetratricopeptide repeat protein [Niveibacterium umoris]|uniref:Putative PEP-CTERM system TPR-repeat lipoprotein n=1 Tax=Niveibacterium umoris TaxID=1193620 RepID=A0A840BX04_9RHOO|nr:XrtA/PEP-CTERM system TPR-repeat protein PrsT [Niveibacterium umoris]MBB4014837.1 putative PEP-CTERM system TPR-repeat lipoprotein [Niveibacterium umoris]
MNKSCVSTLLAALLACALIAGCGESPEKMLTSAREYIAKGDTNAATIQLKNALQKNPGLAEARFLFGRILLESGDAPGGEKELRKALDAGYPIEHVAVPLARAMVALDKAQQVVTEFGSLKPQQPLAKAAVAAALSDAYLMLNQMERAEASMREALDAAPGFPPAAMAFARIKAAKHELPAAISILDDSIKRNPADYDSIALRAELKLAQGQQDEAIADLDTAIKLRPQAVPPRLREAQIYIGQKQFDKADAAVAAAKKIAPGHVLVRHMEGVVAINQGQNEKARDAAQQVLKVAPEFLPAVMLSGVAHMRLHDYVQAQANFEKLVSKAPDSPGPRRLLARALLASKDPVRAYETLAPVLAKDPDRETLMLAGQAALQNGDFNRSSELFAKASAMDPKDAASKLRLGVTRLARGEIDAGMRDLEAAASIEDSGTDAEVTLVMAYLRSGNIPKARAVVDRLIERDPKNPMGYNLLGGVQMAGKDNDGARKAFEKSIELDPGYLAAAMNLARLDMATGNAAAASARFEKIIEKTPKAVEAYLLLARQMSESGAKPEAIRKILDKAITANPGVAAPKIALLELLLGMGDNKAALTAAQEVAAAFPADADVQAVAARAQARAGDTRQAIVTMQKAVSLQPQLPAPLVMLADLQRLGKDIPGAEDSLRKALRIKPDMIEAQQRLVTLKIEQRNTAEAVTIAREVQKQHPKEAIGWLYEADAYAQVKDWPQANKAYAKAYELGKSSMVVAKYHGGLFEAGQRAEADKLAAAWLNQNPKDVGFRSYLAERALSAKDYEGAAKAYRALLEIDPKNAVTLNNLGWVSGKLKDPKAMSYIDQALQLTPDNPAILDTKAQLLLDAGQTKPAVDVLRKAVAGAPNNMTIRLNLARALSMAGDKAAAKNEVDAVLKITPEGSTLHSDAAALMKTL